VVEEKVPLGVVDVVDGLALGRGQEGLTAVGNPAALEGQHRVAEVHGAVAADKTVGGVLRRWLPGSGGRIPELRPARGQQRPDEEAAVDIADVDPGVGAEARQGVVHRRAGFHRRTNKALQRPAVIPAGGVVQPLEAGTGHDPTLTVRDLKESPEVLAKVGTEVDLDGHVHRRALRKRGGLAGQRRPGQTR